jgi:hypothetical protein
MSLGISLNIHHIEKCIKEKAWKDLNFTLRMNVLYDIF